MTARVVENLRRELARRPREHDLQWSSIPCRCAVCRADRFVNRVAAIVVGIAIGYFGAHLLIALFVR